jgi:hypothetical protein
MARVKLASPLGLHRHHFSGGPHDDAQEHEAEWDFGFVEVLYAVDECGQTAEDAHDAPDRVVVLKGNDSIQIIPIKPTTDPNSAIMMSL